MSLFWSLFIAVLTLGSIAGCFWLLLWCKKNLTQVEEGEPMTHEYDGIRELNNPLPRWWSYLFVVMIVFALIYMVLYPAFGHFKGLFNWESSAQDVQTVEQYQDELKNPTGIDQYARELEKANSEFNAFYEKNAFNTENGELLSVPDMSKNIRIVKAGQNLYLQNCAQCHGADARGRIGFPNLADGEWQWGGTPKDIIYTIEKGRVANMMGWLDSMGEEAVQELTNYTLSLSGRKVNEIEAEKGKARFMVCSACHGMDGKGNTMIGAPNLTDNIWIYGGSFNNVYDSIAYGRHGVMPAWENILGEQKIRLVTSYLWKLNYANTDE